MIKGNIWSREVIKDGRDRFLSSYFSIVATVIVVLLGSVVIGLLLGGMFGDLGLYVVVAAIVAIVMVISIVLRQDELAATMVIAVSLYIDWYWKLEFFSQVMVVALLLIFFLARSPRYPWIEPRAFWLWVLFLFLATFPATQGIYMIDTMNYYFNVIFASLTTFWLGIIIARDITNVKRFFNLLACFGTFIAIHTIIQAITGIVLFATSRYDLYFAQISNYQLAETTVSRAGSFLINPDSNGGFFAMMLFIPLGLFFESSFFLGKLLYLAQVFLMLVALLFTYSTGGWSAACAGIIAFIVFVGGTRNRILIALFILIVIIVFTIGFPAQVNLLLQHATTPREYIFRQGAWQTGIRVIRAFPLTGIGLGFYVYIQRAEPYRVISQFRPLAHPHNSYIEVAAMAGLPLLLIFIALLTWAFWLAVCNWSQADARTRSLLGGSIAAIIALSFDSLVNPGWTLPPLAAIGWLILGVISSPLLMKKQNSSMAQETSNSMTKSF